MIIMKTDGAGGYSLPDDGQQAVRKFPILYLMFCADTR